MEVSSSPPVHNGKTEHVLTKKTARDYIFGKIIGDGSFSTVFLAKEISTNKKFAIKICDKHHIWKEGKVEHIWREKNILLKLSKTRFIVRLFTTFQDDDRLYFVMSYAKNGELFDAIRKVGKFNLDACKFYGAEILMALESLHNLNIVHRDLKPENILLDKNFHIVLIDFGSAKIITESESDDPEDIIRARSSSFVGTAQYVSPELLKDKTFSTASDLWAYGCVVYQMFFGSPPFTSRSEYIIFQKVVNVDYEFEKDCNQLVKSFVECLLILDPSKRLGATDKKRYESIRNHPFFEGVNFDTIFYSPPPSIICESILESNDEYEIPDNLEPGLNTKRVYDIDIAKLFEPSVNRVPNLQLESNIVQEPLQEDNEMTPKSSQVESITNSARKTSRVKSIGTSKKSQTDDNVAATLSNECDFSPKTFRQTGPKRKKSSVLNPTQEEIKTRLEKQKNENEWHCLVQGNLILKQGLVEKKKRLFARRRMLLMTTGPKLFYADPVDRVLKGEIPWGPELRVEAKNFKIFHVHTANRTYYLEDPTGYALEWCKAIEDVHNRTFNANKNDSTNDNHS